MLAVATSLLLLACPDVAHGYASGAPQSQCDSMTPGHGYGDTQPCPYTIRLLTDTHLYESGDRLKVLIQGENLKGLILQGRVKGTKTKVGTFSVPDNVKTMRCDNDDDTVTHINTLKKTNLTLSWFLPDPAVGEIQIVATLAKEKLMWWKDVKSALLKPKSSAMETTEETPVTTSSANNDTVHNSTQPQASGFQSTHGVWSCGLAAFVYGITLLIGGIVQL